MTLLDIDFTQRRVIDVFVSPEIAREVLATRNGTNRTLSSAVSDKYAADMLAGRWMDNDQNRWIGFYLDGQIADGQHRLMAISQAGIGRVMRFETGLPRSQAFGIDAHRMRRAADQIKISGVSGDQPWIKKDEIAIANFCFRYTNPTNKRASPMQIVDFCEAHKSGLLFVSSNFRTAVRFVTATPIRVAVFAAYYKTEHGRLSEFCDVLTSGMALSEYDHAAIRLREKIIFDGPASQAGDTAREITAKTTMRAIKAFCERQPIKKLYCPDEYIYSLPEF